MDENRLKGMYVVEIHVFVVAGFSSHKYIRMCCQNLQRRTLVRILTQSGTISYFIEDVYVFLECFKTV